MTKFPGQPLTFGSWIAFSFPQMVTCLFLTFLYLQLYYLPWPRLGKRNPQDEKVEREQNERIAKMIRRKLDELGQITYRELCVICIFFILVFLWFFRSPGFMSGWGDALDNEINDATPAIFVALLLFILPSNPAFLGIYKTSSDLPAPQPSLIEWKTVEKQLPWGVIIIFGGGFALAEGCTQSGNIREMIHIECTQHKLQGTDSAIDSFRSWEK